MPELSLPGLTKNISASHLIHHLHINKNIDISFYHYVVVSINVHYCNTITYVT